VGIMLLVNETRKKEENSNSNETSKTESHEI